MFNKLRERIARAIGPKPKTKTKTVTRMYAGAINSRLTSGWGTTQTSADSELHTSLRSLRARSRALVRDGAYGKRAKVIIQNNVIGSGIGLQAQVKTERDGLRKAVNDSIEEAWREWMRADSCHTGGTLHFSDLERMAMGQIFEAGEVFIRKHYRPFGMSDVPFALEIIEAERVVDEFQPSPVLNNGRVRMGCESDMYHRPVAWWIHTLHPGEVRLTAEQTNRLERIPAEQMFHLRIVDRWPQTRGEPWMHAVMRRLNDMDGYSEAEIVAARGAAAYMATIESDEEGTLSNTQQEDGSREVQLEPGLVERLSPGEKMNFNSPNRPNSQMDPFMRLMLREVAAGVGCSYESLSRDYSQSNYSSSRLSLLDDRELWRVYQLWFIRSFREPLHREWLQQATLARVIESIGLEEYAVQPEKFYVSRFKPRGWGWIDPTKEVAAYKEAEKAGYITKTRVISLTGGGQDLEDVLDERRYELDQAKDRKLKFDTDPGQEKKEQPQQPVQQALPLEPEKDDDDDKDNGGNEDEKDNKGRKTVSIVSHRTRRRK